MANEQPRENDIALVVIDAVSPDIDENGDIALSNIQKLVRSGIADTVYEFFTYEPTLGIEDPAIKRQKVEDAGGNYRLEAIPDNIILAGGSLGNRHKRAFDSILAQAREAGKPINIIVPLDCTYSFEPRYDSGESWTDGDTGRLDMEVLGMYHQAIARAASASYITMIDGNVSSQSGTTTFQLWSTAAKMHENLAAALKR